jgi:hypothetical protein
MRGLRGGEERTGRDQTPLEVRPVVVAGRRRIGAEPLVGHVGERGLNRPGTQAGRQSLVGGPQAAGEREKHMVGDQRERIAGARGDRAGVVLVEGGAVVDQPRPAVPDEQVAVPRGPVDVRRERVEPDDVGGELRADRAGDGRVEIERTGEEVDAEVLAVARRDQLVDLGVGLGPAERRVENLTT